MHARPPIGLARTAFAIPIGVARRASSFAPALLAAAVASTAFAVAPTPLVSSAGAATPPVYWTELSPASSPPARVGASMAYDPASAQMVLFGGESGGSDLAGTWTYDGSTWEERSPPESPSARDGAAMAFDPANGQMVLFGGSHAGSDLNDTWTYNGTTWTEQAPPERPPPLHGAAMAFDEATGQMVLFGGSEAGTDVDETWTYNGATWTVESSAQIPPSREGASMAFDPASRDLILFGGSVGGGDLNDTWMWTGGTWVAASAADRPPARAGASMEYDPATGQMVLFGGSSEGTAESDTWTFGSDWTRQAPFRSPAARAGSSMAFDQATGQMILFAGAGAGGALADTWSYAFPPAPETADVWSNVSTEYAPAVRAHAMMAYDPEIGKIVLFGGGNGYSPYENELGETWTYDGSAWQEESPASSPEPREGGTLAYDPAIGELVLFGGYGEGYTYGEAWTYDGATWRLHTVAESNYIVGNAVLEAGMAFDPAFGRIVLFGGEGAEAEEATWRTDGTTWEYQNLSEHPAARYSMSMEYDPATAQMVLFGGVGRFHAALGDTWTYGASGWTEELAAEGPSPRYEASMAFDPQLGRMLLYGGKNSGSTLGETWTYDGAWSEEAIAPGETPMPRRAAAMAYDPAIGKMIMFGGMIGGSVGFYTNETWAYEPAVGVSAPGAPGKPVAVMGGEGQATVTVSEPAAGAGTDYYTVTAIDSTNPGRGGQTCIVTQATGSCELTGLQGADSYTFTATASNAAGPGGQSEPSNALSPTGPAETPPAETPPAETPPAETPAPGKTGTIAATTNSTTPLSSPAPAPQCRSARSEAIHWKLPRGVRATRVLVRIDGIILRTLAGSAREAQISLVGRTAGRIVVSVIATSRSGARYETERSYHPCLAGHDLPAPVSLYLTRTD